MDLFKAIKGRRTIRRYVDKIVEKDKIERIIDAANWAPSACNRQAWKFVVIDNHELRDKLVKNGIIHLRDIPVGIFVFYDNRTNNVHYYDYIQSASAAIQNMLLTAYSLGLGSNWVCHLPRKNRLRKMFNVPWYFEPIALVTMGYYDKKVNEVRRLHEVNEIVSYNKFDFEIKRYSKLYYKIIRPKLVKVKAISLRILRK